MKALKNRGHSVYLFSTKEGVDNTHPKDIFYIDKNKYVLNNEINIEKVIGAPPDIIIFNGVYIPLYLKITKWARKKGIPYIISPRSSLTEEALRQKKYKKRIGNLLGFGYMVKKASALHLLNESEQKQANRWNKINFVAPNGIDVLNKEESIEALEEKINVKTSISFIGRLDINHKGLDVLLNAFKKRKEDMEFNHITLNLYGPSVNSSEQYISEFIRHSQIDNLVNLNAPVYGSEKEEVLNSTDIFIHTSRFEGLPMSVLEALSKGVPALLTPGTNISEEVDRNQAGWEVPLDPDKIALKILDIASKESIIKYKKNAISFVKKNYSWDDIAGIHEKNYLSLID